MLVNKKAILKEILAQLAGQLESFAHSARAAHAEATHEQSKAENKYDTRALEASYLARGQSRQAVETEEAWRLYASLELRAFGKAGPVDVGALVEVESADGRALYFIGPRAGGLEIVQGKKSVLVLTPQSPLGSQLMGKKAGDRLRLQLGGRAAQATVLKVS